MTPTRPYLVRAFYDWILDNGMTPYMLVDATVDGTFVPASYVRDGRIVLNVAPAAVTELHLGVTHVSFSARFGGVAQLIRLPVASIMAIYARENGQGMFFGNEDEEVVDEPGQRPAEPVRGRPALRVVK
ncbi:MAG: ClpXP protease specificity-enhancing factor [Pseudomonadota bacterium]